MRRRRLSAARWRPARRRAGSAASWRAKLINVSDTLETTREAFRERDRRLDEQNERLAENWKTLQAARHTLTERNQRLTATCQQLEATRRTLAERGQQLTATRKELAATGKELAATRRTLAERGQQLTATRKELTATRKQLAATGKELAATGKELAAARETAAGQNARIAELAADLDAARRRHLMALARHGPRRGPGSLEVLVRPTPEWLAEARERGPGPALELRRNGWVLARAALPGRGRATPCAYRSPSRGAAPARRSTACTTPRPAPRSATLTAPGGLARAPRAGRGRESAAAGNPRLAARCGPSGRSSRGASPSSSTAGSAT